MKKIISLVLILAFLTSSFVVYSISSVKAQQSSSSGSISDSDPLTLETVDQVEAALADARQKLSDAGFSFKLLQRIKKLEARLFDLTVDGEGAKPTKCISLFDQITGRTNTAIDQVENKSCSAPSQRIAYRGMCNPFLSNFQACEANEHGHGHSGGGHMMSEPSKPSCLSDSVANSAIADLQTVINGLNTLKQKDTNLNGIPDFCERPQ